MSNEQTIIEHPAAEQTGLPPGGGVVTARDCVYDNQKYSKGAVIHATTAGQELYECTGDRDGSWKKVKKDK